MPGIWVGKFETTGTAELPTILPNSSSLRCIYVNEQFNSSRLVDTTLVNKYGTSSNDNSHMMKNIEWGAVAYLSSSIYGRYNDSATCIISGCKVWINNNSNFTTGCSGDSVAASSSTLCNVWNTKTGVNASTTGNIYGIYDMSGGAWEYVMGASEVGQYSGFTSLPDNKYYDKYDNSSLTSYKLGDATKEVVKSLTEGSNSWYDGYNQVIKLSRTWVFRGGLSSFGATAGLFFFYNDNGSAGSCGAFRIVLTAS